MIISDKQELRRCVKQLVRRADVCEASLHFDMVNGETGVEAMLDLWARPALSPSEALARTAAEQTPFSPDAAAMFAALDAMDLPVKDLDRAANLQREYERGGYIREMLDTLRAKCVLIRVPLEKAGETQFDDERLEPLLDIPDALFAPGRYGVNYQSAAQKIAEAASVCGARNIRASRFDRQALRWCLMPLCEDQGFVLHVHLSSEEEVRQFALLMDEFTGVRALSSCDACAQSALIEAARTRTRMLICLADLSAMGEALKKLGTRFVPFSADAVLMEQMLGRWILAREQIWQALAEAYLPLCRSGYPLETAAIEQDVRRLLSGNLLALCRSQEL